MQIVDRPGKWVLGPIVAVVVGVMAACTSGAPGAHPSPTPLVTSGPAGSATAIPDGTYALSISERDVHDSGNGHLINLAKLIEGRYEMRLRDGRYAVTLQGRSAVPHFS